MIVDEEDIQSDKDGYDSNGNVIEDEESDYELDGLDTE